jgi:capping protein (actin filament) muscle Z-line, beta
MIHFKEVGTDTREGKDFLKCEYNRDGDSYRSPWSNQYFPEASEEAVYPSNDLLQMEQKFNDVFNRYA